MVERQCATQRCSPLTGFFAATVGRSVLSANRAEFPSFRVEFPSFENWRRDVPATEPRARLNAACARGVLALRSG
jgi:hypothetical protein